MRRTLTIALRFAVILAILTLIPMASGPTAPGKTPYLSALSDLSATPALAASCKNLLCPVRTGIIRCAPYTGFNCKVSLKPSFSCTETPC
jgi:hypothetical protein